MGLLRLPQAAEGLRDGSRIYAPPVQEGKDTVELAEDTVRYLRNVLRLGRGDGILLFDGTGWEYRGVIERLEGREGTARIVARERVPS